MEEEADNRCLDNNGGVFLESILTNNLGFSEVYPTSHPPPSADAKAHQRIGIQDGQFFAERSFHSAKLDRFHPPVTSIEVTA